MQNRTRLALLQDRQRYFTASNYLGRDFIADLAGALSTLARSEQGTTYICVQDEPTAYILEIIRSGKAICIKSRVAKRPAHLIDYANPALEKTAQEGGTQTGEFLSFARSFVFCFLQYIREYGASYHEKHWMPFPDRLIERLTCDVGDISRSTDRK